MENLNNNDITEIEIKEDNIEQNIVLETKDDDEGTVTGYAYIDTNAIDGAIVNAIGDIVTQQVEEKEKQKNSQVENYTNVSPFTYKETDAQVLRDIINRIKLPFTLPSGKILDVFSLITYITRNKNKINTLLSVMTPEQKILLTETDNSLSFISKEFMQDIDNSDLKFKNDIKYGNSDTGIINSKNTEVEPNSKKANIGRFLSIIGLGNNIDIPLYHSGFRITCKAPTQADFAKLEFDIFNSELNIGRDTSGFISSNRKGFAMDIICTLITDCIISTTLKLDDSDDILKYISILDFNIILLGLIQASNPNKLDIQRPCSNIYTVEDERVICGEFVTGVVDPSKLLFINTDVIDETMLSIIARKSENSVTKEDRELYIKLMKDNTRKFQKIAGDEIKDHFTYIPDQSNPDNYVNISYNIPTIYEYLESSNLWLSIIKAEIEDILNDTEQGQKQEVIGKIINNNQLAILSSNIGEMYLSKTGDTYTDPSDIIGMLTAINNGDDIFGEMNNQIQNYVATSMFAICGIPNYTCPKCKQKQNLSTTLNDEFKSFIPMDMMDFFFKLIQHRNEKLAITNTL